MCAQAQFLQIFDRALDDLLAQCAPSLQGNPFRLAVALSGGRDSSALLELAAIYCKAKRLELIVFHVHHGLSSHADAWLAHCAEHAQRLGLRFDACRVVVNPVNGGIEAAARVERYRALGDLCRKQGVNLLLTAHHQDDQAETLLLQLLRGAGVNGLAGMPAICQSADLLGDGVALIRPLLTFRRQRLHAWLETRNASYVEDESNRDIRYLRNGIRHRVMPAIEPLVNEAVPCMARSAMHLQSAAQLMEEVAREDLQRCSSNGVPNLDLLRKLSDVRIDNVLRYWLACHQVRMPTSARLREMRRQLFCAREDGMVTVRHDGVCIHRYANGIYLESAKTVLMPEPCNFCWRGESSLDFPVFGGVLYFDRSTSGMSPDILRERPLTLRLRKGGERLKLAINQPTRDIKHHYQRLGIPFWRRRKLPFVCDGETVLFAADIGTAYHFLQDDEGGNNIVMRWENYQVTQELSK